MIYEHILTDAGLTQGDVINDCPLIYWLMKRDANGVPIRMSASSIERVVVLTQACDLANAKTSNVQVAVVHATQFLIDEGILKAKTIGDQIRRHRVFGWYFLPADDDVPESIVDLRDIHTIPRELLEEQIRQGSRLVTITSPYREHLAQHFAVTYSRIALPEPYETQSE